MGPKDSLDHFVSQIRRFNAALRAGGVVVDPCILSMVFMRGLDDRYELLKQHFVVSPEKYARMSVDQLLQETLQIESSSQHLLHSQLPKSAGHASAASGYTSTNASQKRSAPLSVADIKHLAELGHCVCGRENHTVERCGQLKGAGYVVTLASEKSQQQGASQAQGKKKRSKGSGGAIGSSPPPSAGRYRFL